MLNAASLRRRDHAQLAAALAALPAAAASVQPAAAALLSRCAGADARAGAGVPLLAALAFLAAAPRSSRGPFARAAAHLPAWVRSVASSGCAGLELEFFALALQAAARHGLHGAGGALAAALSAAAAALAAHGPARRPRPRALGALSSLLSALSDGSDATLSGLGHARLRLARAALALLQALLQQPVDSEGDGTTGRSNGVADSAVAAPDLSPRETEQLCCLTLLALRALLPAATPLLALAREGPLAIDESAHFQAVALSIEPLAERCLIPAHDAALRAAALELLVRAAACAPRCRVRVSASLQAVLQSLLARLHAGASAATAAALARASPPTATLSAPFLPAVAETLVSDDEGELVVLQSTLAGLVRLARLSHVQPRHLPLPLATALLPLDRPTLTPLARVSVATPPAPLPLSAFGHVDSQLVASSLQSVCAVLLADGPGGYARMVRGQRPGRLGARQRGLRLGLLLQLHPLRFGGSGSPPPTPALTPQDTPLTPSVPPEQQQQQQQSVLLRRRQRLHLVLEGGLCALITAELGSEFRNAATYRLSSPPVPAVPAGSAAFDASASVATVFELTRELAAARTVSVAPVGQRGSSVTAKEPGPPLDVSVQALARCSELVSLIVRVVSACDHTGLTAIAADALVDAWVHENAALAAVELKTRTRSLLPRLLKAAEEQRGLATSTSASAPAVPDAASVTTADPSDRTAFRRGLIAALARLCVLRSGGTRSAGAYAVSAEVLASRYIQQAAAGHGGGPQAMRAGIAAASAPSARVQLQAATASALTYLGRGLRSAAASASLELRAAASDSARSGLRLRFETELALAEGKRSDFRQRMLSLVTQLGAEAYRRSAGSGSDGDGSESAALLGAVLPALAHALAPTPELTASRVGGHISRDPAALDASASLAAAEAAVPQRSSVASVRAYRGLWLALVALRFVDGGGLLRLQPHAWLRAVRAIAMHTPVLVVRPVTAIQSGASAPAAWAGVSVGSSGTGSFDMDLASGGPTADASRLPVTEAVLAEMLAHLAAALPPGVRATVVSLPGPQVAFLRSVLALETLRASTGSCKTPLLYLLDPTVEQEGLGGLVDCVVDAAFDAFADFAQRLGRGPERAALLRDHSLFFLAHCAHRFARVRRAAFRLLVELADRFPRLLWDEAVVQALLDAVEALAQRAHQGNGPPGTSGPASSRAVLQQRGAAGLGTSSAAATAASSGAEAVLVSDPLLESGVLRTSSSPYAMHAPAALTELADVLADVTELACQWMLRATAAAPAETRALFQRFLSRLALVATRGSLGRARGDAGSAKSPPQPPYRPADESHAGLLAAMHGLAPPWASAATGPLLRPFGMAGRVRSAAQALLGHAAPTLALQMGLLSAADVRVRLSGVGAGVPQNGGGIASGGAASAGTGPAEIGGAGSGGIGSSTAASGAGSHALSATPFAGPAALRNLGGFYASSWARLPPPALLAQLAAGTGAPRLDSVGRQAAFGERIDEESDSELAAEDGDDDSAANELDEDRDIEGEGEGSVSGLRVGDELSVSGNSLAPRRLNAARSHTHDPASTRGGRSSASVSGNMATPQGGLGLGTATALVAAVAGLNGERETVAVHVAIDPLSMLSSRLATSLAGLTERRNHFLGQIEGMAAFHASAIARQVEEDGLPIAEAAEPFEGALHRDLSRSAVTLLVLAQLEWREALLVVLRSQQALGPRAAVPSAGSDAEASALFGCDLINDIVGAVPAEALPTLLGAGRAASTELAILRVRRQRRQGGAVVVYRAVPVTAAVAPAPPAVKPSRFSRLRQRLGRAASALGPSQPAAPTAPALSAFARAPALASRRSFSVSSLGNALKSVARASSALTRRSAAPITVAPPERTLRRPLQTPLPRSLPQPPLPSAPPLVGAAAVASEAVATAAAAPSLVEAAWGRARWTQHHAQGSRRSADAELTVVLYRVAAFAVWLHDSERDAGLVAGSAAALALAAARGRCADELLPLLVWLPVRAFTVPSLTAATECWTWLLAGAACPAPLRLRLLSEITAAWVWTISMQMGLFSGAERGTASAAAVTAPPPQGVGAVDASFDASSVRPGAAAALAPRAALPAGLRAHEPHRLIIDFFAERLRLGRAGGGEELALLVAAVTAAATSHEGHLCAAPAAFGGHVRLVHLELAVLQACAGSGAVTAAAAQHRLRLGGVGAAQPSRDLDLFAASEPWGEGAAAFGGVAAAATHHAALLHILPSEPHYLLPEVLAAHARAAETDEFGSPLACGARAPRGGAGTPSGVEVWPAVAAGSLAMLRERAYRGLLAWFELAPSRYEVATSSERVRADFPYMVSLCRLMRADARLVGLGASGRASAAPRPPPVPTARDPRSVAGSPSPADARRGRGPAGVAAAGQPAGLLLGAGAPGAASLDLRRVVLSRGPATALAAVSAAAAASSTGETGALSPSFRRPALSSPYGEVLSPQVASPSPFGDESPAFSADVALGPWPQTFATRRGDVGAAEDGAFHVERGAVGAPLAAAAQAGSARAMLDLALLLLGHEMDRIAAWHNPLDVEERRLAGEAECSVEALLAAEAGAPPVTSSAASAGREGGSDIGVAGSADSDSAAAGGCTGADGRLWARYASAAWSVSPLLALRLGLRLRGVRDLTLALQRHVLAEPRALCHEPLAVHLLVTAEAAAADAPQLELLVLWAPAAPTTLLDLLARCSHRASATLGPLPPAQAGTTAASVPPPQSQTQSQSRAVEEPAGLASVPPPLFAHPAVAAYVVRSLDRLPAEQVVFILPQLVQALRHDAGGLLADFLFATAQRSMLLAQQLAWVLASESTDADLDADMKHAVKSAASSAHAAHERAAAAAAAGLVGSAELLGRPTPPLPPLQSTATATAAHGFQRQLTGADSLPSRALALSARVASTLSPAARGLMELQYAFWDQITNVSGRLKTEVADKAQRKAKIREFLRDLQTEAERDYYYARDRMQRRLAADERVSAAAAAAAAAPAPLSLLPGAAAASAAVLVGAAEAVVRAAAGEALSAKRSLPLAGALRVLGGRVSGGEAGAATAPLEGDISMPTNPFLRVVSVDLDSGRPMQSAAKCPFLLSFVVEPCEGPDAALRHKERQLARHAAQRRAAAAAAAATTVCGGGALVGLGLGLGFVVGGSNAMLRARLGAQHAALVVRRRIQRQRVQVGLRLERTREQVGAGLRRHQRELERGVTSMVAKASEGMARFRGRGVAKEAAAAVSAALAPAAPHVLAPPRATEVGGDGDDTDASAERHARAEFEDGDLDTRSDGGGDDEAAYAEADGARRGSEDEDDVRGGAPLADGDDDSAPPAAAAGGEGGDRSGHDPAEVSPLAAAAALPHTAKLRLRLRDRLSSIGRKLRALKGDRRGHLAEGALLAGDDEVTTAAAEAGEDAEEAEGGGEAGDGEAAAPISTRTHAQQAQPPQQQRASCIFKVFDDCRQDALAMQFISLCKHVFDEANLGLGLFPYRIVPTRTGTRRSAGGILECVPEVRSRDEIGKAGFPTLYDYFVSTFGRPDGAEFEAAQRNFVRSMAAYSVVCYLLRIKDRHNGNVLISTRGHLVHIDFGFLLGISPGGNLGFETAAFKLTQEMIDVMGGTPESEMFQTFAELSCRAFLLARENAEALQGLVAAMADSDLPCFFFADTLPKLWSRFRPGETDRAACRFWRAEILGAAKSVTTTLYDGIQKMQNNVSSERWG